MGMKWLFDRRFNIFDSMIVLCAAALFENGRFWTGVLLIILGMFVSLICERATGAHR
jgi:uncharacterized membrane protein